MFLLRMSGVDPHAADEAEGAPDAAPRDAARMTYARTYCRMLTATCVRARARSCRCERVEARPTKQHRPERQAMRARPGDGRAWWRVAPSRRPHRYDNHLMGTWRANGRMRDEAGRGLAATWAWERR